MKHVSWLVVLLFTVENLLAQYPEPKPNAGDPSLPSWVVMMYDESVPVPAVDSAYAAWFEIHDFEETVYTRWYRRWKQLIRPYVDETGLVNYPDAAAKDAMVQLRGRLPGATRSAWTFAGPEIHYTARSNEEDVFVPVSDHANIYSVDRSPSNPSVLYAGSENGGVYKSEDAGNSWNHVTADLPVYDVKCVKIHPYDPSTVLFGAANDIYRTADGGISWQVTGDAAFQALNIYVWDLHFNLSDPMVVFAGTNNGLYRSTDGGLNWVQVFPNLCMSVMEKPGNSSVVYALQYDPIQQIPFFWKSVDGGITFFIKPNGWFSVPPVDLGKIESSGGKIAVTEANPERVYVLLVGNSNASATLQLGGYIGVYTSTDAGENWSLPQGYLGAPYDVEAAPCLMDFDGQSADYNQIYYNTCLAVSTLDENRLLIGGLNLWRSDDGATTYQPVGGYLGTVPLIHPDMQSIKVYKTSPTTEEVWWSSDGGINYSTDFINTHESRCRNLYATALWGFDQGWNNDMMVAGRYHNGNMGFFEGYPDREFIALGGAEAPTGYVDYSDERKAQFSDIGTVIVPETIDGITQYTGAAGQPNESYYYGESSRILYDWDHYHIAWMGKDNKLYRSLDGGSSFATFYTFGNSSHKIIWIEQSRVQTEVMYVQQFQSNKSVLWKTADGGTTWSMVSLPVTNQKYLVFTLSATNSGELWLAYSYGANGQKVYHTTDGGASWTNLTTPLLDDINIWSMAHQFGTGGGIYLAARPGIVFYRNHSMNDWEVTGSGLPLIADPLRIVPYYKGNKIRLATWTVGVWEHEFHEPSALIADFGVGNQTIYCAGDTIYFSDHSVAGPQASYSWNFPGGSPAVSYLKNPESLYSIPGVYEISLMVTEGGISDTITKSLVIDAVEVEAPPVTESFESGQFDDDWLLTEWSISETVGGFGQSDHCMFFDNYDIDLGGQSAEVRTAKYDFSSLPDARLTFDIAYAKYGAPYLDTLEILASTDCGETFFPLYKKGGTQLATVPGNYTSYFIPEADQWSMDSLSLDAFAGFPETVVAFRNIGYYGNVLYIDNINVFSPILVGMQTGEASPGFDVFPNPGSGLFRIRSGIPGTGSLSIMDAAGRLLLEQELQPGEQFVDLADCSPGMYWLKATAAGWTTVKKVVIN